MSTAQTAASVPGISSRRFACDRCRVQKARCLREHADQARCDRCVRADAECVTSPTSRRRSWQIIAYDSSDASMLGKGTKKRQRRGRQDEHFPTPDESSGALVTHFANSSHSTSPFYSDQSAALPISGSTLGVTLPEASAENAGGNVARFEAMFSQSADPTLEYIEELGLSDEFFMPEALSAAHTGPRSNDLTPNSGTDGTLENKDSGNIAQQGTGSLLQKLSRLDYELITLLTVLDKGRPHVTMDTLISPIDETKSSKPAVDDVLNRTREFVDVLEAFSSYQPLPSATQNPQKSPKRGSNPSDTSRLNFESDHDTPSDSSIDSMLSEIPSSSSNTKTAPQPTAALDSTALLAILTVYIRVLRLHLVIFSNVFDFVKEIAESDDPVLCPVPGLNFSSFPIGESRYFFLIRRASADPVLPESGNLQTIIFIQIVTSLFERLETLLGLPCKFRIGGREWEAPGLFEQQDFLKIAGPIIGNEEVGASESGQGGVMALRRYIKETKQLLKESIAR